MATYEIDLTIRAHVTVEVDATNADAAWAAGEDMVRANVIDPDRRCTGTSIYLEEVEQVRQKEERP